VEIAIVLVVLVAAGGAFLLERQRRRRKEQDLARLLRRDPRMTPTGRPCGIEPHRLPDLVGCLPRGDRRSGIEYGVEGPLAVEVTGYDHEVVCAALRWWWEERRRSNKRVHYVRRSTGVVLARVPWHLPVPISVTGESVLGRLGLTRGGRQLESSEFNRRFRVTGGDDRLTLMLLDADMQRLLLEEFAGRDLEIVEDLVVLAGSPSHRDETLTGFVGELPALRQDMQRVLAAVPAQFRRAVAGPSRPSSPPGTGGEVAGG
jgi:hypothetical protein